MHPLGLLAVHTILWSVAISRHVDILNGHLILTWGLGRVNQDIACLLHRTFQIDPVLILTLWHLGTLAPVHDACSKLEPRRRRQLSSCSHANLSTPQRSHFTVSADLVELGIWIMNNGSREILQGNSCLFLIDSFRGRSSLASSWYTVRRLGALSVTLQDRALEVSQ